jgi:SpoVK/Ycf46/Vps4 family AAA+-type ATPase
MAFTQTKLNYIREGQNQDQQLRTHIRNMLGIGNAKVQSKKHTIISGPPGIGKSYSTMEEIRKSNVNYIQFGAGATDSAMAIELAYNVNKILHDSKKELVVLLDDADDILFRDYETANKFKFAMAKDEPFYAQDVNLIGKRAQYEKAGRMDLVEAIDAFTVDGKVGLHIPTDQVRFYIVCNKNCENKKEFPRSVWTAAEAIVDRTKYRRLDFEWRVSWGWLAYVLMNYQPFHNYPLSKKQKEKLADWMWDHWERMRNQSMRTVEEMAEYMINDPANYEDIWEATFIKKV